MDKNINISASSKDDVVSNFRELLANTELGKTSKGGGNCRIKYRRQDTVDGNPGAATKQCYPYRQGGGLSMGVNGPRGGKSGSGTYGD